MQSVPQATLEDVLHKPYGSNQLYASTTHAACACMSVLSMFVILSALFTMMCGGSCPCFWCAPNILLNLDMSGRGCLSSARTYGTL